MTGKGLITENQFPDGTYYYSVTYTTITDNIIFLKGDVTILR
jgi:hypothetical protein